MPPFPFTPPQRMSRAPTGFLNHPYAFATALEGEVEWWLCVPKWIPVDTVCPKTGFHVVSAVAAASPKNGGAMVDWLYPVEDTDEGRFAEANPDFNPLAGDRLYKARHTFEKFGEGAVRGTFQAYEAAAGTKQPADFQMPDGCKVRTLIHQPAGAGPSLRITSPPFADALGSIFFPGVPLHYAYERRPRSLDADIIQPLQLDARFFFVKGVDVENVNRTYAKFYADVVLTRTMEGEVVILDAAVAAAERKQREATQQTQQNAMETKSVVGVKRGRVLVSDDDDSYSSGSSSEDKPIVKVRRGRGPGKPKNQANPKSGAIGPTEVETERFPSAVTPPPPVIVAPRWGKSTNATQASPGVQPLTACSLVVNESGVVMLCVPPHHLGDHSILFSTSTNEGRLMRHVLRGCPTHLLDRLREEGSFCHGNDLPLLIPLCVGGVVPAEEGAVDGDDFVGLVVDVGALDSRLHRTNRGLANTHAGTLDRVTRWAVDEALIVESDVPTGMLRVSSVPQL